MVNLSEARRLALALPASEEKAHFDKPDFRVKNKIFAVLHKDKSGMVVKLSLPDQSVFCAYDSEIIYPLPGGWGRKGWTMINLKKIKKPMLVDVLTMAWKAVAPASLVVKHFPGE